MKLLTLEDYEKAGETFVKYWYSKNWVKVQGQKTL